LNLVVSQTNAPALNQAALRRGRLRGKALAAVLITAIAVAAFVTWLHVAHTIRHPHPVKVTRQPRVNALVWSHRVFVDAAFFKRWLDARDISFAAWSRQHPGAVAVFNRRPVRHR